MLVQLDPIKATHLLGWLGAGSPQGRVAINWGPRTHMAEGAAGDPGKRLRLAAGTTTGQQDGYAPAGGGLAGTMVHVHAQGGAQR